MTRSDHGKPLILVVTDEPADRDALLELLGDAYECRCASSAELALNLLPAEEFDLVLVDIRVGGIGGPALVPLILDSSPDAVVVVTVGERDIEGAGRAMRAGAFGYVTKPPDPDLVKASVARALDHQSLRRANRRHERELEELVGRRAARGWRPRGS